jgi:hypothetical protein
MSSFRLHGWIDLKINFFLKNEGRIWFLKYFLFINTLKKIIIKVRLFLKYIISLISNFINIENKSYLT